MSIPHILFYEEDIKNKIKEIATEITSYYTGSPLVVVCVLKGAFMFFTELVKQIKGDFEIDFIQVSSYHGKESSGNIIIKKDLDLSIKDKHVLIVDGIVDSGTTLDFLIKTFKERSPLSIRTAILFDKECKRKIMVPIDYRGFIIEDLFVVGYGGDYNEKYRNLPFVIDLDKYE